MTLSKTTQVEQRDRIYLDLEKNPIYDALPAYFEQEYPKFTAFLEKYYEWEDQTVVGKYLQNTEFKRDFVAAGEELLRFFSKELLLGRDYYDTFVDKKTAIQTSNLLYRSKGSQYAIQQFFRVFFGFDAEVRYGRDEVFLTGDPNIETAKYTGEVRKNGVMWPGSRLNFTFDDGDIQVLAGRKDPDEVRVNSRYMNKYSDESLDYVEDADDYVEPFFDQLIYDVFIQLVQDEDYYIDYGSKTVVLTKNESSTERDEWTSYLAETGKVAEDQPVKVVVKRDRPAGSSLGDEVTNKRITNNGFWQLFSLAIQTPISIKQWREAYKDFVHPSGMYLEGSVLIQSKAGKLKANNVDMDQYRYPVHGSAQLLDFVHTTMSELNIDKYKPTLRTWSHSGYAVDDRPPYEEPFNADSDGRYAEEMMDSDRPDIVYRSRINDLSNGVITMEEWDTQYLDMAEIDDINSRRFDLVTADMSQTINTMDENFWHKETSSKGVWGICPPQYVLGSTLDFPPEYPGCPGFIFGVGHQTLQGQYEDPKMMDSYPLDGSVNDDLVAGQTRSVAGPATGVARSKRQAYRDARVWGYTNEPQRGPNPDIDYTTPVPSATPSSQWEDELDFVNDFERAQITATVNIYPNYYVRGYIDQEYFGDSN